MAATKTEGKLRTVTEYVDVDIDVKCCLHCHGDPDECTAGPGVDVPRLLTQAIRVLSGEFVTTFDRECLLADLREWERKL